jgi:hypothetical protein
VTIEGISYAGSGCNAGSVAGAISSDAETITLLYDSFIAQAGPGITPAEARKNCQLNVQLRLPQGWQFSVFKADYRGYAYLQDGDKGVIKATYYFSGDSTQVSSELDLKGAYDDNYLKTDEFGIESTVWSPCGEEGLLSKSFFFFLSLYFQWIREDHANFIRRHQQRGSRHSSQHYQHCFADCKCPSSTFSAKQAY